jgi:putative ABC transport system permease protein
MRWIRGLYGVARRLGHRQAVEKRLAEEVAFHIEQQTAQNRRAGMAPDEARRRARLQFGGVDAAKEATRDEFRLGSVEDIVRDLGLGLRSLRRRPAFTTVAALTLALGIGAATVVFSVVNGVLLKPLPYPDAGALVAIWHAAPGANIVGDVDTSAAQYFTYRTENRTFQHVGLWAPDTVTAALTKGPEQLQAVFVTHGTLDALAVPPVLGRWFSREDDAPAAPPTVILSYGFWRRQFGGDGSIIGSAVTINAQPSVVIGVMPSGFRFLTDQPDVIVPFRFNRATLTIGQFNYRALARLEPGIALTDANADVARMLRIYMDSWPLPRGMSRETLENIRLAPALRPLKEDVVGDIRSILWIVMATAALVLVIACVNVANLVLVHTLGRQAEFAIRGALGAGRIRIARGLLLEYMVLATLGGVLGTAGAFAALPLLVALAPATLPRLDEIRIDGVVIALSVTASVASGMVLALAAVVRYAGPRFAAIVRTSRRATTEGPQAHRLRGLLVAGQVALALVLLVGAGLMIRTFVAMRAVDPGFTDPDRVQLVRIAISPNQVPESERVMRLQADIRERLAALHGVTAVSYANAAPLEASGGDVIFADDGQQQEGRIPPVRRFKFVAPGAFSAVGTRLVAGRDFTWTDVLERRPVAVISENMAREMWRSPNAALGKRLRENTANPWREIVGVVADLHDDGVELPARAIVYWPAMVDRFGRTGGVFAPRVVTFLIRSARSGSSDFVEEIRRAVWAADANIPVAQVRTLGALYAGSMARASFTLVMLAIAAAMALLLGAIGVFGAVGYLISQRRREIGVRIALGAQHRQIRRAFVRQGLAMAALGIGCGLFAAVGLTRFMTSLLFGISPLDGVTYVVVATVMFLTAALASYIPAHRATNVDPVESLRAES